MEIYLMQHGPNLPPEQDPQEGLSPEGTQVVTATALALARLALRIGLLISSPKDRARQSAEIVARVLNYDLEKILISDQVKAMAEPGETLQFLAAHQDQAPLMVVGHLPNLAKVAAGLLSAAGQAKVDFQRGGICAIEVEDLPRGKGKLLWYLPPEITALMAP
ncbi:MAG: histidine phosphatase family protein [Desulfarculus sp.]|nr:histidine phosphatase family protein [Pseudomonadota bacterium]MBV1716575.1 histidine phosphatase family protein [Desulfarculus sp.]MBU4575970.1 histidine phosphatase family protein [Pseudomonadota bacterium]MBU4597703.1 histidine phosphatase family protein [Pseudomonadota bacterium]MBV1736771.1 histidine phosphatase family protein [Desulfarculus sp.]